MEKLSDYLRRLATTLDDDYDGNILRVMQHLLEIVKQSIASDCVRRKAGINTDAYKRASERQEAHEQRIHEDKG